jgi:hypothetical protein
MPASADAPVMIDLSPEEARTGILSDDNLFDAVDAFYRDGIIVLKNAIDVEKIDALNERMLKDTEKILSGSVKNLHWK